MTLEALKQAAENPNLPEVDRQAARKELERLNPGNGQTGRHKLEAGLLQSTYCLRLADVSYIRIHRFCSDRNWNDDAKGLYFDYWLPVYMTRTAWGQQQLSTTVDYLSRDRPCPDELKALIDDWRILREVRRRFKADPEFAALFTSEQIAELHLTED